MSRISCISIGALVLLATVHASQVEEEDKSGWGWEEATTVSPGWGSGWGWQPEVSGDNAAFGQTIIIGNLAGNQSQSASATLEGISFDDYELGMVSQSNQTSEIQMNINGASPAGGEVQAGFYTASAEADGPYLALNQGAALSDTVVVSGALLGGIISNPQTNSAVSAGSLVLSSSGQASNGTNVNPGAGSGWGNSGWGNSGLGIAANKKGSKGGKKTRTQPQRSGWGADQTGSSASESSLVSGTNISQSVSSSDNITVVAVQDYDYYTMGLDVDVNQETAIETFLNTNGGSATSDDASATTQWQSVEIQSNPENNGTYVAYDYVSEVALNVQPTSNTTISIGNITVSDWATASSGTNLVNQNNGWGSSSGWAAPTVAPPSGWKAPLVKQMGYPVV